MGHWRVPTATKAFGRCAFGKVLEMRWPDHPSFPSHGYVITRKDLDQIVAERAEKAGAQVLQGCEALEPLLPMVRHRIRHRTRRAPALHSPRARRRFCPPSQGRSARIPARDQRRSGRGTSSSPTGPTPVSGGARHRARQALLRSAWRFAATTALPRHDDLFIESHLDLRDPSGAVVPGYGWIFPLGDGRVNVGVGLLTVTGRWKGLNTSHLMEAFVESAPRSWGLSPETSCGPPTGGKLPMGFAIQSDDRAQRARHRRRRRSDQPVQRRRHRIRVRDRAPRGVLSEQGPLRRRDASLLDDYEQRLQDSYGDVLPGRQGLREADQQSPGAARLHAHGNGGASAHERLCRIMANLMRPDTHGRPRDGLPGDGDESAGGCPTFDHRAPSDHPMRLPEPLSARSPQGVRLDESSRADG